MTTKSEFLEEYRRNIIARYTWAEDSEKLERFMESAMETITTELTTWDKEGDAVNRAWRAIGKKGKPTYKALRALPD